MKVPFKYLRMSKDLAATPIALSRQDADCDQLILTRQWCDDLSTVRAYTDTDSAWKKSVKRPGFEQMLRDLHEASCLVAYDEDRLLRQPRDLERLIDRCEDLHLNRMATCAGDIDLTTSDGQLLARMKAAVAKKSSDDTSRRAKRALRDRAENGLHHGPHAIIGYQHTNGQLTLSNQADHLRDCAHRMINGTLTLAGAAAELDRPINRVKYALLSPTLIGRTSTGHLGNWPAILSELEQAQLRSVFDTRRRGPNSTTNHWLTGILHCNCTQPMRHAGGKGTNVDGSYNCPRCPNYISAFHTEWFVTGWVVDRAAQIQRAAPPELAATSSTRPRTRSPRTANAESAGSGDKLADLAAMYARGDLTAVEWEAARAILLPAANAKSVPPRPMPVENLTADKFASMTVLEKRQAALAVLAEHGADGYVVVDRPKAGSPRGRFDSTRLRMPGEGAPQVS
jgi:DNA invertase Pin-like site-specific DNA recombinase